jgi:DNA-directed RNA polymerase sigma subunit (sigma70/sigma32)
LLLIWWRTATAELDRPGGGSGDEGAGLPLLERIAAPTDGADTEHSLLPLLLQRLSAEQRRLLWHRYLREHPLNPRQIEKVMGLDPEQQQRLEEEALALLRQAAKEFGALGKGL